MYSTPRRWELKPLSPVLQPSDLRSIVGPTPDPSALVCPQTDESPNVLVTARQVNLSQDETFSDDEWQPGSPGSSGSGSHCGFYSFVEDATSPEAQQNQAWMVSPQRQAQLALLKEEKGFKLQTYSSGRKPESLFPESNGDLEYKVDPCNGIDKDEEKQLRMEIIRSQAPKMNQSEAQKPVQSPDPVLTQIIDPVLSTDRLIEGFSLTFRPDRVKPKLSPHIDPETVDKEQISFSSARQKFLQMEQERLEQLLSPVRSSKTHLNLSPDVFVSRKVNISDSVEPSDEPTRNEAEEETGSQRKDLMFEGLSRKTDGFDDLDSGLKDLPVDHLSNSTQVDSWTTRSTIRQETPIEREIRLTQEREEDLRRSRGLKLSWAGGEMVLVKTRHSHLSLTPDRVHKKNQRSFILHSETQKDSQRKELPQQQEQILDRNNQDPQQELEQDNQDPQQELEQDNQDPQQELEQDNQDPQQELEQDNQDPQQELEQDNQDPQQELEQDNQDPPLHTEDTRTEADPQNDNKIVESESETDEVFLSPCCPHRHPEDVWSSFPTKESEVQDTRSFQHQVLSPPASLMSTTVHKTAHLSWKDSLLSTGLQSRGQGAPCFIEKEIEEDLRREQELRDMRESMMDNSRHLFSPAPLVEQASNMAAKQFYPPSNPEKDVSVSSPRPAVCVPSISYITAKPWTSSPAPAITTGVRMVPLVPRSLTESLLQDYEEHQAKLKLEESSYAGIQLVDDINNEVVESTRVVRHKNRQALRWEAGLFTNQQI